MGVLLSALSVDSAEIPTIDAVFDDTPPSVGIVRRGGSTDDHSVVLSGLAHPSSKIIVLDNSVEIGVTRANKDGFWAFTTSVMADDSKHSFRVLSVLPGGVKSETSAAYDITVTDAPPSRPIEVKVDTNALINGSASIAIFGVWALYFAWKVLDRLIFASLKNKLPSDVSPAAEERRINQVLSQIGLITKADRVLLGVFHNGEFSTHGYSFYRVTVTNVYVAPDSNPPASKTSGVLLGDVLKHIESCCQVYLSDGFMLSQRCDEMAPICAEILDRDGIYACGTRIIKVKETEVGILMLHYETEEKLQDGIESLGDLGGILNSLYEELAAIVRRRVVRSNKIFDRLGKVINMLRSPN